MFEVFEYLVFPLERVYMRDTISMTFLNYGHMFSDYSSENPFIPKAAKSGYAISISTPLALLVYVFYLKAKRY